VNNSIYIAICCIGIDHELIPTVQSAIKRKNKLAPNTVNIGLVCTGREDFYQNVAKELESIPNLSLLYLSPQEQIGLGSARNSALAMFNNEDYILQIDAHTCFQPNWDSTLIERFEYARTFVNNKKVILTCPLGDVHLEKNKVDYTFLPYTTYLYGHYPIIPGEIWNGWRKTGVVENPVRELAGDLPHLGDFITYVTSNHIAPSSKICGHFIFSDGSLAKTQSLPNSVLFWEDEYIQTVNLLADGYTLVYPGTEMPLNHSYNFTERKQWSNIKEIGRETQTLYQEQFKISLEEIIKESSERFQTFINNQSNQARIENFYKYSGIDLVGSKIWKTNFLPGPKTNKIDPLFPIRFANSTRDPIINCPKRPFED